MQRLAVTVSLIATCLISVCNGAAVRTGFDNLSLVRADDTGSVLASFGFNINVFGVVYSSGWVNMNGNITFSGAYSTFSPFPLREQDRAIIAPFWADVDTRNTASSQVKYGVGTVAGRSAFGVTYKDVGYFANAADKLNSFQVVLIDRSDTGIDNFDVEFNYDRVLWETGSASGGSNGFGGRSARVGITNGTDQTLEWANSGETLAFLDSNLSTGLKYASFNSGVAGRLLFAFRAGILRQAIQVDAGADRNITQLATQLSGTASFSEGALTYRWMQIDGPAATIYNSDTLTPFISLSQSGTYNFQLTVTSVNFPSLSAADSVTIRSSGNVILPGPARNSFQDIRWMSLVNAAAYIPVTGGGSELAKQTGDTGWNSEGISSQAIVGEGFFQWKFGQTTADVVMALSSRNIDTYGGSPEYAIIARPGGTGQVVDYLNLQRATFSYTTSDVFSISRERGVIKYYKNNVLLAASPIAQQLPLFAESNVEDQGGSVNGCRYFGAGSVEPVKWISVSNMTASVPISLAGSRAEKTGGGNSNWNAEAIGGKQIAGDGSVQWKFGQTTADVVMALSSRNIDTHGGSAEYAIIARPGGTGQIVDYPNLERATFSYTTNDVFSISREQGTIKYYKNNVLLATSPIAQQQPLFAECNVEDQGGFVTNCTYYNAALYDTAWTNVLNTTASLPTRFAGSRLEKTAGGAANWNAEAIGGKQITGDGSVQWKFGQTTADVVMALSSRNIDTYGGSPEYAIIARPGGTGQIVDYPNLERATFNYTTNDVFSISREQGTIKYYKNNVLLATSPIAQVQPLFAECNIEDQGGFVTNCLIEGILP